MINSNTETILTFDTETSGRKPDFDTILEISATLSDFNFNKIDEFNSQSRLPAGVLISPSALITHGTPFFELKNAPSHFQMIKNFKKKIDKWAPRIWCGFNEKFDDKLLTNALFQNFNYPFVSSTGNVCRFDAYQLCVASFYFANNSLSFSENKKGRFKLENLTKINGIDHLAHQAKGDVRATIEILKKLKNSQYFTDVFNNLNFHKVNCLLLHNPVLAFCDPFGPRPISFLDNHPVYGTGWALCWDLQNNPSDFKNLDSKKLESAILNSSPKIVRQVPLKHSPIFLAGDHYLKKIDLKNLTINELKKRAELLTKDFKHRIFSIFNKIKKKEEGKKYLQFDWYQTFFKMNSNDKELFYNFAEFDFDKMAKNYKKFESQVLKFWARDLIFDNNRESLSKNDRHAHEKSIAKKLLTTADVPWLSLPKVSDIFVNLNLSIDRNEIVISSNQKKLLADYDKFLNSESERLRKIN